MSEDLKCPLSGIRCSQCAILGDPDLEYCPIVKLIECLEELVPEDSEV